MELGTQVAKVPSKDPVQINHPRVEYGFVVRQVGDAHFVRYWVKGKEGQELRTASCAELTPDIFLIPWYKVSQNIIDVFLVELGYRQAPNERAHS